MRLPVVDQSLRKGHGAWLVMSTAHKSKNISVVRKNIFFSWISPGNRVSAKTVGDTWMQPKSPDSSSGPESLLDRRKESRLSVLIPARPPTPFAHKLPVKGQINQL